MNEWCTNQHASVSWKYRNSFLVHTWRGIRSQVSLRFAWIRPTLWNSVLDPSLALCIQLLMSYKSLNPCWPIFQKWIPTRNIGVLAGNSVHADKAFLAKEIPEVVDWLHYRQVPCLTVRTQPLTLLVVLFGMFLVIFCGEHLFIASKTYLP